MTTVKLYDMDETLQPGDIPLIEQGTRRGELSFENGNRELMLSDVENFAADQYRVIGVGSSRRLNKGEINACRRLAQTMRECGYVRVTS